MLAHVCRYSGAKHLPELLRISARQDSIETRRLPPQTFITTDLVDLWSTTRITSCKHPRGTPFRFKLSAGLAACAARSRARQFSLALLYRYRYLSSHPCSTRPTVAGQPRAGLITRASIDRNSQHYLHEPVSVSPNPVPKEWGRRNRFRFQRPVACSASRFYRHAASAVSSTGKWKVGHPAR